MHSNYKHACAVAEGRMMKNDQKNKQYNLKGCQNKTHVHSTEGHSQYFLPAAGRGSGSSEGDQSRPTGQ